MVGGAHAHPQRAVHALSLLSSTVPTALHTAVDGAGDLEPVGNTNAQAFWVHAARSIDWIKPPRVAYGRSKGKRDPTWFPDATLNTCFNALDRHVRDGHGARPCFKHVSTLPPARNLGVTTLSYARVLDEVKVLAGVLRNTLGIFKGDRVIIYMPMIPETAFAMLACARIGAIHSTVFGGFAPRELAKRIDDARPRAILAASCGIEPKGVIDYKAFVDEALKHSQVKPAPPVLLFRRQSIVGHSPPRAVPSSAVLDWAEQTAKIRQAGKLVEQCEEVESDHPLYILYTSGTTGMPKGVVRLNGGHAVASRYSMEHTFGLTREDTMFCASDFGWVVGHCYILYCPLLLGCTSIIYEGKPILPDAGIFWKVVQDHKVAALFTAPTALRSIRREDPSGTLMRKYDLRSLRALFLAGERSEPGIVSYYQNMLAERAGPGAVVNDNYWSTESGSPITALSLARSCAPPAPRPGAAGMPLPGMDVRVVDDEGREVAAGVMGNIVLALPLPPSMLGTVWRNEPRFQEAYFDRFRGKGDWFDTGDAGVFDEAGYLSVLSRVDDVLNVAGHRLGTSLLEQVVSSHPFIAECCVVGLPDDIKGHVPFALVTRGSSPEAQRADLGSVLTDVNAKIRAEVGGIAALGGLAASRLPKTRSGKTLRRTIRTLVDNAVAGRPDAPAPYPPTIEDAGAVDDARKSVNEWVTKRKKPGAAVAKL